MSIVHSAYTSTWALVWSGATLNCVGPSAWSLYSKTVKSTVFWGHLCEVQIIYWECLTGYNSYIKKAIQTHGKPTQGILVSVCACAGSLRSPLTLLCALMHLYPMPFHRSSDMHSKPCQCITVLAKVKGLVNEMVAVSVFLLDRMFLDSFLLHLCGCCILLLSMLIVELIWTTLYLVG